MTDVERRMTVKCNPTHVVNLFSGTVIKCGTAKIHNPTHIQPVTSQSLHPAMTTI